MLFSDLTCQDYGVEKDCDGDYDGACQIGCVVAQCDGGKCDQRNSKICNCDGGMCPFPTKILLHKKRNLSCIMYGLL